VNFLDEIYYFVSLSNQTYFDVWGEKANKDSPNEAVWMKHGKFSFCSSEEAAVMVDGYKIQVEDTTTTTTTTQAEDGRHPFDIYTTVAVAQFKARQYSKIPLFMYMSYEVAV
jgi:hypothetical protein